MMQQKTKPFADGRARPAHSQFRIFSVSRLVHVLLVAVLLAWAVVASDLLRLPMPAPLVPAGEVAEVAPKLVARGQVRPARRARIATLSGGVISQLGPGVGAIVEEGQEVARVRGPGGIEVVTAPWRGTVTRVPVQVGDSVTPGSVLVTIGDLSRLQVETTDVDEFLIGHVRRGQSVPLVVDALDGRELRGYVGSVTLEPQTDQDGDEHYPVTIDLTAPPDLRPGMTVRIDFAQ